MYTKSIIFIVLISCLSSCYSFRGTSIPANVKSYYVDQTVIDPRATLTPGDLPELFMEALRAKIRNQSGLIYNDATPDIEFMSTITQFEIADDVRGDGESLSTLNKITATVKVEYLSAENEEENWNQNFSHTINYDPSIDLQSNLPSFIDEILEQITEQVFNKAFTNW